MMEPAGVQVTLAKGTVFRMQVLRRIHRDLERQTEERVRDELRSVKDQSSVNMLDSYCIHVHASTCPGDLFRRNRNGLPDLERRVMSAFAPG
jgi:hypothetical protein